jgi:hypothetical protein
VFVEQIQRKQFSEFTDAWDQYMQEYEANALLSIQHLQQEHLKDLQAFRESFPH